MIVSKNKNTACRIIEGQAYIVNTKTSMMHELDETATFIWQQISKKTDSSKVVEKLCKVYDVSESKAKKDVEDFLNLLVKKGLIEVD